MTFKGTFISESEVTINSVLKFINIDNEMNRISYSFEYETLSIKSYDKSYADIVDFLLAFEQIRIFSKNADQLCLFIQLSGYNDFSLYESKYMEYKSGFHSKELIKLLDMMRELTRLRYEVNINSFDEFVNHPIWNIINVDPKTLTSIEEEYTITHNFRKHHTKFNVYLKNLNYSKASFNRGYTLENKSENLNFEELINKSIEFCIEPNNDIENSFLLDNIKTHNNSFEENTNRTKEVKCPVVIQLTESQKELIYLISCQNENDALIKFESGFDWAFSFDRNVNLLHLAIIFNANKIANYLIDNNINIFQNTSKNLLGFSVFSTTFPCYLSALDLADAMCNIQISSKLREKIVQKKTEEKLNGII